MAWKYKVIEDVYKTDQGEHVFYRMAEVHLNDKNEPNSSPIYEDILQADSKEELAQVLLKMIQATAEPTLVLEKDRLREGVR